MRQLGEVATISLLGLVAAACFSQADPGDIVVYGPYVGPEADVFREVIEAYEEETGVDVTYTGTASFVDEIDERLDSGLLPDVILLPQPGMLFYDVRDLGILVPLDEERGRQAVEAVGSDWESIMELNGQVVAVPYRFVVKSLVWYRPDVFADLGYAVPQTLDGLHALTDRMIADGVTPWCAGMDDFASTGWWGTDWVEDIVLRRAGPEAYDEWWTLQRGFDDEAIVSAMEEVEELLASPGAVAGGRRTILGTIVSEGMDPMFEDPPRCLMHRQASFQAAWLPSGFSYGDGRLDAFLLPSVDGGPAPVTVSGEMAVLTSTDPAAADFMVHLVSEAGAVPWQTVGGSLIARAGDDTDLSDDPDRRDPLDEWLVQQMEENPEARFDASDLMPRDIGSTAFWNGMIDLFAGVPADEVAADIQEAIDAFTGVDDPSPETTTTAGTDTTAEEGGG